MKNMKRFIASLSMFAMLFSILPLQVAQAQVSTTFFGFKLDQGVAASFSGDQQVGAGAFSSGNIANGNSGVYSEGMCVPLFVRIHNTDPVPAVINSTATFDHNNGGVIGYTGLEAITGSSISGFDNLSDIVFTGDDLTTLTSVTSNLGANVPVTVTGPFGPTNAALVDSDAMGHYNVSLTVPSSDTVDVPFCARLSDVAGAFSNGSELQLRLGNGETININPSNLLELPELTVVKTTTDGSPASDFTMQVLDHNNSFAVVAEFPGSETGTSVALPPGTYSVSEVAVPGYIGNFGLGCTGITMVLADTAQKYTCTVTNSPVDPDTANLNITKVLVDAPVGTLASQFLYNLSLNGFPSGSSTAFGDDGFVTVGNIEVGTTVQVTEQDPGALWTASYSADCGATSPVAMDADGLSCVITNTYVGPTMGTLHVVKELVQDNGGAATADNFAFQIDGGVATAFEADGQNDIVLTAGTYDITEVAASGYTTTYNNCTDVVVPAGGEATCTITNDDMAASLTVVKLVNGGPQVPSSDFTMSIMDVDLGGLVATFAGNASGEVTQLDAGSYRVGEVTDPDYVPHFSGDCDEFGFVTLIPGQTATCIVSNEYSVLPPETGRVTIAKQVVGSSEPNSAFEYALVQDSVPGAATNFSDAEAHEYVVEAGTAFSVVEYFNTTPFNYTVTMSDGCVGFITPGSVFNCVVTNTANAPETGTLTVEKIVVNSVNTDALATEFSYYLSLNGGAQEFHNFEVGGTTYANLPVGTTFEVVEVDHGTLWDVSYSGCSGVMTADGATCTVTNTFNDPYLPTEPIRLIDPCIAAGDEGRLIAQFGYESDNDDVVTITAGPYNFLTGDSSMVLLDSQVEDFEPGLNPNGFTVDFDAALSVNWTVDWDLDGVSPATVTASANSPLCVQPEPATLTVYKIVNNHGGTAVPSDFLLEVRGTNVSTDGGVNTGIVTHINGAELGTVVTMNAGEYSVMELNGTGYDVTYSSGCAGTAEAGQSYSCTVTNTEIAGDPVDGTLTVHVVVNGGTATPSQFHVFVNGDATPEFPQDTAVVMAPGGYTIFEEALTGYETTFSGDCAYAYAFHGTGNIDSDEDAVCTITNTYVGGPSGGGSSGGGSNGGGNDGDNDNSNPPGEVLGDTDEQDEVDPVDNSNEPANDEEVVITPPAPIVLGESDELPRTGVPIAGVLALGSVLTFLARRREQD